MFQYLLKSIFRCIPSVSCTCTVIEFSKYIRSAQYGDTGHSKYGIISKSNRRCDVTFRKYGRAGTGGMLM